MIFKVADKHCDISALSFFIFDRNGAKLFSETIRVFWDCDEGLLT